MNKIIQINLAGQAISIDERAYEILKKYLGTLNDYFKNTDSGDEIINDIEARITELFQTKLKGSHTFISEADVTEATELMGSLSQIGVEEDEEYANQYSNKTKKLFRDPDDKILGGVCAGLAAYLNMDTSVLRLVTLLLVIFAGVPIVIYIILWIVMPEAKTSQDRFRMHGETPNISDIADNIRNEAGKVASNLKKNSSLENGIKGIGRAIERLVNVASKLFGAGVLSVLVIVGILISVILIGVATGNANFHMNGAYLTVPQLFDSSVLSWIFSISLLCILLIPIATLCFIILQFIFNMANTVNLKAVFMAWLLSLAVFIGVSVYSSGSLHWNEIQDFKDKFEQNISV